MIEYTPTDLRYFWSHVHKTDGCWLWTAALNHGYGHSTVRRAGKTVNALAHCVTWTLFNGPIPDGYQVTHHCPGGDNKACCNPDHLRLLTAAEHAQDKMQKRQVATAERNGQYTHPERRPYGARNGAYTHPDRVPRGDRTGSRRHPERRPRGEAHGNAKLTDDAVREIRQRYAAGGVTQATLALQFGVDRTLISLVVRRKFWKHIS